MKYLLDFLNKRKPLTRNPLSNEQHGIFLNSLIRLMNVKSSVLEKCSATHSEIMLMYISLDWFTERGEYISAAQAAKMMGVSAPSVSRTLKSLEKKGLIERALDKNDHRSVRIIVTKTGERRVKRVLDFIFGTLDNVCGEFSDEELTAIVKLHCKFVDLLVKANERRTEC